MKKYLVVLLMLAACKGPAGDKGDKGTTGTVNNYTGSIDSNSQAIPIPAYGSQSNVDVYVSYGGATYIQLPYSATSVEVTYDIRPYVGTAFVVVIENAKLAGLDKYKVVIINQASGLSKLTN